MPLQVTGPLHLICNMWISVPWTRIRTPWRQGLSPWYFLPGKGEHSIYSKESLGVKESYEFQDFDLGSADYILICSIFCKLLFNKLFSSQGKEIQAHICSTSAIAKGSSSGSLILNVYPELCSVEKLCISCLSLSPTVSGEVLFLLPTVADEKTQFWKCVIMLLGSVEIVLKFK